MKIPEGRIVTYGDISHKVYGTFSNGQAVASAIKAETNRNPDNFPWWRVVNLKLKPTLKPKGAIERLKKDKIEFRRNGSACRRFHDPDVLGIA